MPSFKLPEVTQCCCVTDLKTAATVIAVLAIVTSPAISWSVMRHSYVIRVSCFISSSAEKPDIVDISLNNIISFGFGANAGLGPSCLKTRQNGTKPDSTSPSISLRAGVFPDASSNFITVVKTFGWIVLSVDLIFVLTSINFLIKIVKGSSQHAAKVFMITASIVIILSFIYGMLYVSACISLGGAFPMFEFFFIFFDSFLWFYYILVVNSYRMKLVN